MPPDDLEKHSLQELIHLLAVNTKELLELMTQRGADGIEIRDKRQEVKKIQEAINKKKSATPFNE